MAIYSHTRACRSIYVCAASKAAGARVGGGERGRGGGGGGGGAVAVLKNNETRASWVRMQQGSDYLHRKKQMRVTCLPEITRGNSICHRSCHNLGTCKPGGGPRNCLISKPKRGGSQDPRNWTDPHLKESRDAVTPAPG